MTNAPSTIDPSTLPTWNLADLYSGPDAAELMADLDRIKTDADAFRERFQGRLVSAAPSELSAAITAYEALGDLMGRIGSFAFLHYVGDQQDAARTKLFGDVQGKLTEASSALIFFELELNQIEDKALAKALEAPALKRYAPWFADLRKAKPFQLAEDLEKAFHDKSQTSSHRTGD